MPQPDGLSFEPVDHDPFAAGQFSGADIASMTHQAPDTSAKPAIDAAFGTLHAFLTGGLQGVANLRGTNTPDWSKNLGAVLSSPEANAAIGMTVPLGKGITAFHGSPHDFDAFDMSKIGTGEGAQAYGHGLYFAENEGTAAAYRSKLSFGDVHPDALKDPDLGPRLRDAQAEYDRLQSQFTDAANSGDEGKISELSHASMGQARYLEALENEAARKYPPGRMYQVSINADPEHFLDWDKPLSEQPDKVRSAIVDKMGLNERNGDLSGRNLMDRITNEVIPYGQATDENISKTLRAAGIPGIKYLDQGSRAQAFKVDLSTSKGPYSSQTFPTMDAAKKYAADKEAEGFKTNVADQGTRNYVVFDDKLISIMKKYGIAGIGALPGLGAYHFQTDAVDHDPFAGQ